MIKSKLGYIMLDKKIKSVAELSRETGIHRDTLTKLYNEIKIDTVSLGIIFKLCDFFQCPLQDLIEYIPNEESSEN
nr:MAG TPA: Cro/C1-type HTH DNA-binding domain protein [Caudoviricetes sp.]